MTKGFAFTEFDRMYVLVTYVGVILSMALRFFRKKFLRYAFFTEGYIPLSTKTNEALAFCQPSTKNRTSKLREEERGAALLV